MAGYEQIAERGSVTRVLPSRGSTQFDICL